MFVFVGFKFCVWTMKKGWCKVKDMMMMMGKVGTRGEIVKRVDNQSKSGVGPVDVVVGLCVF